MKRLAIVLGIVAVMASSQVAHAIPFGDTALDHWTNWNSPVAGQDGRDVLGQPDLIGGDAVVDVTSRTLSRIDLNASTTGGNWIGLAPMDLFINVLNSGNNNNNWDYVVKTEGWGSQAGGNFNLYDVTSLNISAYKTNTAADNVYNMAYERIGQPSGLNDSAVTALTPFGSVHFNGFLADGFNTSYDFSALNGGGLNIGDGFIIGWGITCGNDVIYEQVPVPEPGTMMLLGIGMLGMAVYGKRRMNKLA